MESKNTLIAIAISAAVSSLCTAAIFKLDGDYTGNVEPNAVSAIRSELTQLKTELALETQARTSLEQQLRNPTLTAERPNVAQRAISFENQSEDQGQQQLDNPALQEETIRQRREQQRADRLARQQPEFRQQQLVAAGFAEEEAARIVQIESEASLRQLQAQYDRRRERAASGISNTSNINAIRSELGDQNYERYLEANGWPTSARVGSVIGGSAGDNAGLLAGDKIISYGGERVFNLGEINNLTIQGQVGESVLVEIDRNGEPVQLTIPRGPIGINSGRRFGR